MIVDLLSSNSGQDRLLTGSYKSNGNLVSIKLDIIDATDFNHNGCISANSQNGDVRGGSLDQQHTHHITGTLECHPDNNTVRICLTLPGGPTLAINNSSSAVGLELNSETGAIQHAAGHQNAVASSFGMNNGHQSAIVPGMDIGMPAKLSSTTELTAEDAKQLLTFDDDDKSSLLLASATSYNLDYDEILSQALVASLDNKDVKPWVMTTNKMANGGVGPSVAKSVLRYPTSVERRNSTAENLMSPAAANCHQHQGSAAERLHNKLGPDQSAYSPFCSPVSPPSHEGDPPPLMELPNSTDQLMSEIQSMDFDFEGGSVSQGRPNHSVGMNGGPQQQQPIVVSLTPLAMSTAASYTHQQRQTSSGINSISPLTSLSSTSAIVVNTSSIINTANNSMPANGLLMNGGASSAELDGLKSIGSRHAPEALPFDFLAKTKPLPQSTAASNCPPATVSTLVHSVMTSAVANSSLEMATPVQQQQSPHQIILQQCERKGQQHGLSAHVGQATGNIQQMTLLQPKQERSDSICSEYSKEDDFFGYSAVDASGMSGNNGKMGSAIANDMGGNHRAKQGALPPRNKSLDHCNNNTEVLSPFHVASPAPVDPLDDNMPSAAMPNGKESLDMLMFPVRLSDLVMSAASTSSQSVLTPSISASVNPSSYMSHLAPSSSSPSISSGATLISQANLTSVCQSKSNNSLYDSKSFTLGGHHQTAVKQPSNDAGNSWQLGSASLTLSPPSSIRSSLSTSSSVGADSPNKTSAFLVTSPLGIPGGLNGAGNGISFSSLLPHSPQTPSNFGSGSGSPGGSNAFLSSPNGDQTPPSSSFGGLMNNICTIDGSVLGSTVNAPQRTGLAGLNPPAGLLMPPTSQTPTTANVHTINGPTVKLTLTGGQMKMMNEPPTPRSNTLTAVGGRQYVTVANATTTSSTATVALPTTAVTVTKPRNRRNSSFDETKPHVCGQCGARFTTKSNLGQHAKIHLAVKPFICEICSHGFTRAAHYESHVAKHKGLKTHRCEQCGESFARMDNLLRHSARHKHGKIFNCNTCNKGFHRKDKLLEHEKVHSEYKFQCPKCTKAFHTNDALKHHLPNHEDSSKTQCNICLKFIALKSLAKHMATYHKVVTFGGQAAGMAATASSTSSTITTTISSTSVSVTAASGLGVPTIAAGGQVAAAGNGGVARSSKAQHARGGSADKTSPCQYCRKSFASPAKLRLHVAKCHAEEKYKHEMAQNAAAAAANASGVVVVVSSSATPPASKVKNDNVHAGSQQSRPASITPDSINVFLEEFHTNLQANAVEGNGGSVIMAPSRRPPSGDIPMLSNRSAAEPFPQRQRRPEQVGSLPSTPAAIKRYHSPSGDSLPSQQVPDMELAAFSHSSPDDPMLDHLQHHRGGGEGVAHLRHLSGPNSERGRHGGNRGLPTGSRNSTGGAGEDEDGSDGSPPSSNINLSAHGLGTKESNGLGSGSLDQEETSIALSSPDGSGVSTTSSSSSSSGSGLDTVVMSGISIPTIHIPEYVGDSAAKLANDIPTDTIQALLFS